MKKITLILTVFLIGLSVVGQVQLNQYSSIPNIEQLEISAYGGSYNVPHVLFSTSNTLYTSSYEIDNNQFGPFNSINTTVNDITHSSLNFAIATSSDVIVYNAYNNTGIISTITGNSVSVCVDNGYVTSINSIGTDIYKTDNPIHLTPTSFSVYEPLKSNVPPPIQKLSNDLKNGTFFYMTDAKSIYAENQRHISSFTSQWNSYAALLHDNNTLLDFGMYVSPFDNDTMFHFVYDNNEGFIYNATTDTVDMYFYSNITSPGITSLSYNKNDSNLYYTKPNSNKVYTINTDTFLILDYSIVAYTMPGMNNSTEIEFDLFGNIWVSGDNGIFTSLAINGIVTGIEDEKDEAFIDANLYPNPNNGNFTIENVENNTNVIIFSIDGRLVYSTTSDFSETVNINLDLKRGSYFVQLIKDDKKRIFKFIKQ